MRKMMRTAGLVVALGACSTAPVPLVPDTADGPASYVCYSTWTTSSEEVRAIAARQCRRSGMEIKSLLGQSWTPLRCGLLTPEVAAFSCGRGGSYADYLR